MAHDKEVWKHFEDNALTHSAAHYLMTIHELLDENGYARVTDIAKRLNITRGSCSISLKTLKARGLVLEDHNKFLSLSEEGMELAKLVERNDDLLEILFRDILGVDPDQAEIDACKIEHLLSIETSQRLAHFVAYVRSGDKCVTGFLQNLHGTTQTCDHDVSECPICNDICFLSNESK
jgi:Mn-dependent DtxR family transcriptional regulator